MEKIVGSVDDRSRPVVRLEIGEHSLLLLIDTDFNGDLLLSVPAERAIELGDGTTTKLRRERTQIPWLGAARDVRVLVSDTWQPRSDDPVGLVGTELIMPQLLLIDFA